MDNEAAAPDRPRVSDVWSKFTSNQWVPRDLRKRFDMDYALDRVATKMVQEFHDKMRAKPSIMKRIEGYILQAVASDYAMNRGVTGFKGDPFNCDIGRILSGIFSEAELYVASYLKEFAEEASRDVPAYLTVVPYMPWPVIARELVDRNLLCGITVAGIYDELRCIEGRIAGSIQRMVYLGIERGRVWELSLTGYPRFVDFSAKLSIDFDGDLKLQAEELAKGLKRHED